MTTDENDIVLDPFMGTGTTAVAAKHLGRNYIGFEIDRNYVRIAKDKIDDVQTNSRIGDSWISFYLNEPRTIRNVDWNELKKYFNIPKNSREIDKVKISLLSKDDIINTYTPKKDEQTSFLFSVR